ncbi:Oidioi.mRNA.OKI2018_I69.PAR.g11524.t1.cds [Oikopleura dioica]|uniref:Oidioi.mRNA.OKI2018_I69.PAR.g11524.t1.cds n=1 Tax=Oikopleura dioica TaxID=34765 RepID=A0ABN7S067_OIKDI|nr:Oidioi.mRNA.OKI2018_I69.PAR.g11524.t1.cds [Oikopleura dioica]
MKLSAFLLGLVVSDEQKAMDSVRSLGWEFLFRNTNLAKGNTVVSPLSIVSALYMLAEGTDGKANLEIQEALNVTNNPAYVEEYSHLVKELKNNPIESEENSEYTLELANGAFYQQKFQGGDIAVFAERLHANFIENVGDIKGVDFHKAQEATDVINSWVEEKTHGKIPTIFDEPLDQNTLLVLASSLYYKAEWKSKFEEEKPGQVWFGEYDEDTNVEFIYQTERFSHAKNVCLNYPCKDNDLRLNVVEIPMNGKREHGDYVSHFNMNIWYIAPKQTRAMRRHQTITKANDEMVREIIQARSADYREHIPTKEYLRSSLV